MEIQGIDLLCPLYFPDAKGFGGVIPGYVFAEVKGEYLIVSGDGHAGHEVCKFSHCSEVPDDDDSEWIENAPNACSMRPTEGYALISTAIETAGCDPKNDEHFEVWPTNAWPI